VGWRVRPRFGRLGWLNRSDEPIPATGDGFDVTRITRRIHEHLSQFVYGRIQAMFEVHEGIRRPDEPPQFIPANQFVWPCQHRCEDLEWLLLELHADAKFPQHSLSHVGLERTESDPRERTCVASHEGLRSQDNYRRR
jgi:hypothetical protein